MATPRFKARNIHIIRRAALHVIFTSCPYCGNANTGQPFVKTTQNGLTVEFDATDAAIDYCHLDARSKDGTNDANNLTVGHHRCNLQQANSSIEVHCDEFRTTLTAAEIRTLSGQADRMADDILSGKLIWPAVLKQAAKMIREGHTHRTSESWMETIQSA